MTWASGDVDHDGEPDLVELLHDGGQQMQLRATIELFGEVRHLIQDLPDRRPPARLELADLDGDGLTDLAIGWQTGVEVLAGLGDGTWAEPERLMMADATSGPPDCLAVGDTNGDGVSDLLAIHRQGLNDRGSLWWGGAGGWSGAADVQLVLSSSPLNPSCALSDLDGDGLDDLVTWSTDRLEVRVGTLSSFGPTTSLWTTPFPSQGTLARLPDADRDGDDELALRLQRRTADTSADPAGLLVVWPGAPIIGAGPMTYLPDGGTTTGFAVWDLDADGHTDLAAPFVRSGTSGVRLFFGGPGGLLPAATRTSPLPVPGAEDARTPLMLFGHLLVGWQIGGSWSHALVPLAPAGSDVDADGWTVAEDPDDHRAEARPGAFELAGNGLDEDGDGWDLCGLDADADGAGAARAVSAIDGCDRGPLSDQPIGDDCDDTRDDIYPGAPEPTDSLIDLDCDGFISCFADSDGDGYGDPRAIQLSADLDCADPGESTLALATDCNDAAPAISPGAPEQLGDGVDSNCDGLEPCYIDADGDGARVQATALSDDPTCTSPGWAVAEAPFDCDDANPEVHPGQEEIIGDGADQDCVAGDLCASDADGDGLGDLNSTILSDDLDCDDPGEGLPGDCDDSRRRIGGPEGGVCPERGCAHTSGAAAWLLGALAWAGRRRRR